MLQLVSEAKATKNRMHLDVAVADVDGAMEEIAGLGGRQVRVIEESNRRVIFAADPDGNEFCLGTEAGWAFLRIG